MKVRRNLPEVRSFQRISCVMQPHRAAAMPDRAAPARKGMNTSDLDSLSLHSTRQSQATPRAPLRPALPSWSRWAAAHVDPGSASNGPHLAKRSTSACFRYAKRAGWNAGSYSVTDKGRVGV